MKATTRFAAGVLALALVAGTQACQSTPVRFAAPQTPASGDQGRTVSGAACGFQLLLLIPLGINSRQARAYEALQQNASGAALTDVKVRERWFYAYVGTGYCTELTATVY